MTREAISWELAVRTACSKPKKCHAGVRAFLAESRDARVPYFYLDCSRFLQYPKHQMNQIFYHPHMEQSISDAPCMEHRRTKGSCRDHFRGVHVGQPILYNTIHNLQTCLTIEFQIPLLVAMGYVQWSCCEYIVEQLPSVKAMDPVGQARNEELLSSERKDLVGP